MKSKKTGHSAKLDQFYTISETAQFCINKLKEIKSFKFFLEPAAGTGSFSKMLKNCLALDIDPKDKDVQYANFLISSPENFDFFKNKNRNDICVIGNPPFGKNSSNAVKFFNHSALFADTIAFILPRTFRKKSLQNKINLNYWLVLDVDLPKNSFIFEDQVYDVPCCFQVWVKKKDQREVFKSTHSSFVEFVGKELADLSVRRVGGKTGTAYEEINSKAVVSHYFLKIKDKKVNKDLLIKVINSLDFSKEANSTAGVKSISKGELIDKLDSELNNILNTI